MSRTEIFTSTKYQHYRERPYSGQYAEIVACGRRVNRLSATTETENVTCPKCLLCACNRIEQQ